MNRFADAYGRALFPNRYRPGNGTTGGPRAAIRCDGLDIAIGAGVYRLVNAVEALVEALVEVVRQRARPGRGTAAARHTPTARPVGCG
jgi:hypothetical protein